MSDYSITGGGFNARISNDEPTPNAPRAEGLAQPPAPASHYITRASELTPSEAPVLDLPSASKIAAGVEAALNVHDAAQARANGDTAFGQRRLLADIARRVKAGEITNDHGRIWWETCFPGVDPSTVGGQS